jgi:hypothetical protein
MAPLPEPSAPRPEPSAPGPEPSAPRPEPSAPRPEPSAPGPEPSAPRPEHSAPRPEHSAPRPEHSGSVCAPSVNISELAAFRRPSCFCTTNRVAALLVDGRERYQIEGTADSSNSIDSPFGKMWTIREMPRSRSSGESMPTRWQLARGIL